jgi:DNA (cytosine-5)-methyltransferase 1
LFIANFKYIELFAGIGGFRSAMSALGGECVFASEIDKYAMQAYKALYNGAPELHGDITKIDANDIPDHDVLVGGFPCQAFSVAGQRKGFEDTRGTLFFEIARIAAEKQPKLMLLENVKGLLSHDGGNTFETMCAALNDVGYAIDFRVLNSKYFGVPQNRERIFIVASRDAEHAEWNVSGNDVVSKAKRRAQALGIRTFNFDWPANDTVTTRLCDVLEGNVDERYYLSEEKAAKLISQLNDRQRPTDVSIIQQNQQRKQFVKDEVGTLHASMTNNQAPKVIEPIGEPQEINEGDGLTYALTSSYGHKTQLTDRTLGKKRLTYVGEPDIAKVGHLPSDSGQTGAVYGADGIAPTCLNQHGNAVTKIAVEHVGNVNPSGNGMNGSVYADSGLSPTLTTNKGEGVKALQRQFAGRYGVTVDETGTLQAARVDKVPMVVQERPRYRIRKLTPRECWRLQGFTDAQHDTVAAAGISDSQRYKQAGNAVTVNVISAIGKRLIPLLTQNDEKVAV